MSEDLRIAYEMEAMLVKENGLLIPSRCDCRFKVLASYPGQPWYFVNLTCRHALQKVRPNLGNLVPEVARVCAWVTGTGEYVPIVLLMQRYDELSCPNAGVVDIDAADGASITRVGGVYYFEDDRLRYDEPCREIHE